MTMPDERAAARRATWQFEIVEAGTPKDPAYASLTYAERLAAFAALNARAWALAGSTLEDRPPRGEWPGEVYPLRGDG